MRKLYFFIGGIDREMIEILSVLNRMNGKYDQNDNQVQIRIFNRDLNWSNANLSSYLEDIEVVENIITDQTEESRVGCAEVYAIELKNDLMNRLKINFIDHHDERADEPASILQVLNIFGLLPTQEQKKIAINDSEGWRGLQRFGMEIYEIKTWLSISDITMPEVDVAWDNREIMSGNIALVRLPHSETVKTCNYLMGKYDAIAFICPDEISVYDDAKVISKLYNGIGGYKGGTGLYNQLIKSCFWGKSNPTIDEIQKFYNILNEENVI